MFVQIPLSKIVRKAVVGYLILICLTFCCFYQNAMTQQHIVAVPKLQPHAVAQNQQTSVVRFDDPVLKFLGVTNDKNAIDFSKAFPKQYIITIERRNISADSPQYYCFAINMQSSLEREMLDDSADGAWSNWDIVSAALVSEGVDDRQVVKSYQVKVNNLVNQCRKELYQQSKEQQVRTLFEALHKNLLTGNYDVACTDLARAIDTGHFNCVSATVLYHAMAQKAGLDVYGLEMRGHALSRVRIENRTIDLETTCADWFKIRNSEPATSQRMQQQTANERGYDTAFHAAQRQQTTGQVAAQSQRLPSEVTRSTDTRRSLQPADQIPMLPKDDAASTLREISDVQLIATIYYNQGVDQLAAGHYNESIVTNVKALQLDPNNENAWRNLLATLNNWAIVYASKEDYLNAARLLDEGTKLDPNYALFRSNQIHTYYHWVIAALKERNYDKAMTLCRMAEERLPNQPNIRAVTFTTHRSMALESLNANNDQKAFEQYDMAAAIAPANIDAIEIELQDISKYAKSLIEKQQLSRAIWLIDQELTRQANANAFASSRYDVAKAAPVFDAPIILDAVESQNQQTARITVQPPNNAPLQRNILPPAPTQNGRIPMSITPMPETSSPVDRVANAHSTVKPYTTLRPQSSETTTSQPLSADSEAMTEVYAMRSDATIIWAKEALQQRQYAEAVRRLTIGTPSTDRFDGNQVSLLRQIYRDWETALQSENRPNDAHQILLQATQSPYLSQ